MPARPEYDVKASRPGETGRGWHQSQRFDFQWLLLEALWLSTLRLRWFLGSASRSSLSGLQICTSVLTLRPFLFGEAVLPLFSASCTAGTSEPVFRGIQPPVFRQTVHSVVLPKKQELHNTKCSCEYRL